MKKVKNSSAVENQIVYESHGDLFPKSNSLINSKYKASLMEQKLFNIVLSRLQHRQFEDEGEIGGLVCTLKASELKNMLGVTGGSFYTQLKTAAASMNLSTKNEIFSAMVVYGFLSYENGRVRIPNKELMEKFDEMLQKEESLGYIYRLAKESDQMLKATLANDTKTMEKILSYVHDTETPILSYNHETELSAIVNLAYLSARDQYHIEREDKAGKGFVDFIFYPYDRTTDGVILELKVDKTPEYAISQIKEKQYALRFKGKLAEKQQFTGRILAVGINYDKETKQHRCKVEEIK